MAGTLTTSHHIVVTIPVYNEAPRIMSTIGALDSALCRSGKKYLLTIAEDGSTDGTKAALRKLQDEVPRLLIESCSDRKGRGWALRNLWRRLDSDIYVFLDADLAVGPQGLLEALELSEAGHPVVVGSRYVPGAVVTRPPLRAIISRIYNGLLRWSFNEPIQDHQCGLKLFTREALDTLLPMTQSDSWFWDTEVLVLAAFMRIPVVEMPVVWHETKAPNTPILRLLDDILLHGRGMLQLRNQLQKLETLPQSASKATPAEAR